jgi:excisionase family DNA binding protein
MIVLDKLCNLCYTRVRKEGEKMEKLYTKKEVAEILHCSIATIHRRISSGELKAVKNGRIVRIPESELERFFQVPDTDAPPQPTESPTTGEKITLEPDAQQPEPTTDESPDRPEWDGISGKK